MSPTLSVARTTGSDDTFVAVGLAYHKDLRHDQQQWTEAFGRRTGDIEQIAQLREAVASAKRDAAVRVARAEADTAAAVARAEAAEAREKHLEADLAKQELPWYEKAWNKFGEIEWTWPAAVVAVVGIAGFIFHLRRRRRGVEKPPADS